MTQPVQPALAPTRLPRSAEASSPFARYGWNPQQAARRDRQIIAPDIPPRLTTVPGQSPTDLNALALAEAAAWRRLGGRGLASLSAYLHQVREAGVIEQPVTAERFPELARLNGQVLLWTLRREDSPRGPRAYTPYAYGFNAAPELLGVVELDPPGSLGLGTGTLLGTHDPSELTALCLSQGWGAPSPEPGSRGEVSAPGVTAELWICAPAHTRWSGLSWMAAEPRHAQLLSRAPWAELSAPLRRAVRDDHQGAAAFWNREELSALCQSLWPLPQAPLNQAR